MTGKLAIAEVLGEVAAEELLRVMRRGPDLAGIVSEEMYLIDDGVSERSSDPHLMERVALAIEHEMSRADAEGREPVIRTALDKAGVAMAVYVDMCQHPDWPEVSNKVYMAVTVHPRRPAYIRAQTLKAMAGDTQAAKFVEDLLKQGDKTTEEAMRALESQGDQAVSREASQVALDLAELIEQASKVAAPEDLIEEAKADVAVQHSRPEPEVRLNLQEWSNEGD